MRILYADEINNNIAKLLKAWSEEPTFLLLPERSGVSEQWIKKALNSFPKQFRTNHFALLTSGSTGEPKLVVASRQRAEEIICIIDKLQKNSSAKETILVLPLSYSYAFVNQWLWSEVFQKRFIYTRGFSHPDLLKKTLQKADMAMLCLVSPQIQLFKRYFGNSISFPGIIRLNFAGGPFPQNSIDMVHKLFPNAEIFNNYGCTEAMPRLTIRPQTDSNEAENVGRSLTGIKMKTDNNGLIHFNSPYAAVGFYNNSGFSIVKNEEWISTGDIGEEDRDGYWRIKGRANEVFKRFGEKISIPQLLETVYSKWSGAAEFYRENETSSTQAHILILCPEPEETEYRAILGAFRKNHSRSHWPLRLESTDSFPLLENGKVDRSALAMKKEKTIHWYQRV